MQPPARSGRLWRVGLALVVVLAVAAAVVLWWTGPARPQAVADDSLVAVARRGDLVVTVTEKGLLESSNNTAIKCKVRGQNTVVWVIEDGSIVKEGDVLVRLDTLALEEAIHERTKYAHWSRSAAEQSKAEMRRAELAIKAYEEGEYVAELANMEKDLAIAESNLRTARNLLQHAEAMHARGYVSELEVERRRFAVRQSELDVEVRKTQIDVFKRFTRAERLEMLRGQYEAAKARHAADAERAFADQHRLDRALEELEYCTIRAPRDGLVIYPSTAEWKRTPDIEVGATVHKDQVLLLMPDLTQMQVKVGIHESVIDRVKKGQHAIVTIPGRTLEGTVAEVAPVARPAGWWTGNMVKYDTIVKIPSVEGLKPGMSAEVKVILAEYHDVVTIPLAAVLENEEGAYCWVKTPEGVRQRRISLGDNNETDIIVTSGLQEGEKVVLNPLAYVEEAQRDALKPRPFKKEKNKKAREAGHAKDEAVKEPQTGREPGGEAGQSVPPPPSAGSGAEDS